MLDIIYNEKSGSGKGKKSRKIVEKLLIEKNIEYNFHKTEHKGHATEIAQELTNSGATDIIAMGGDGTLHEVINGVDVKKVNLGIIPCGSGNDFIVSAKIPNNPQKALEIILNEKPKPTDYLDCSGVLGMNIIGAGIDVEILKRCKNFKIIKGKLQYVVSLIISLFKFRNYKLMKINDEEIKGGKDVLITCICNGSQFGGGIRMCPGARIDDNVGETVTVGKMKKLQVPLMFLQLMQGKFKDKTNKDLVRYEKNNHFKLEFDKPSPLQIDGEVYEDLPFDVTLIENGVNFYRP